MNVFFAVSEMKIDGTFFLCEKAVICITFMDMMQQFLGSQMKQDTHLPEASPSSSNIECDLHLVWK